MISEGRRGVDNAYSLLNGPLLGPQIFLSERRPVFDTDLSSCLSPQESLGWNWIKIHMNEPA
jgi:hypothetical protein